MPHELKIERYIDAPPGVVWDVLANRQEEWWCPKPWTVKLGKQERRAGGRSEMTMHGPNGEEMPQIGIYLEYTEGKRFVSTDAAAIDADGDFDPAGPFMIGFWEIAPEGTGTRYTARARHWTEEAAKQHAEMGFEDGWGACADQLAELAETAKDEARHG